MHFLNFNKEIFFISKKHTIFAEICYKFKNKTNIKKIAFILEGKENSGKTSTIKEIVKIICKKEEETENKNIIMRKDEEHFHDTSNKELSINELSNHINKKEEDHKSKDIGLIIQLNNGIKIGIESEGDPGRRNNKLFTSLRDFKEKECDIILCPIRYCEKGYCDYLYYEVKKILNDEDKDITITLDPENKYEKPLFVDKNRYEMIWITNICTEDEGKQAECNEESAELIYGLIEKAISLILEKTSE